MTPPEHVESLPELTDNPDHPVAELVEGPRTPLEDLDTPRLLVDVSRLESNIARTAADLAAANVQVRPHMKTSKCLEVFARQRAAGAIGFTCATPAEVRLLGEAGHTGIVWAHQAVGRAKVEFAVNAAENWGVTLIADSLAVATPISDLAAERGVTVTMLMEVDAGQHRTGVAVDSDEATALATALAALPNVTFGGILTHEGHLGPMRGRDVLEATGRSVGEAMAALAERIRATGLACEIVSVGSTPGLSSAPYAAGVTEARPGTYVYFDANQIRAGSCTIDACALTVLSRVVSVRPGQVIIDAGLKAMSADALTPENGGGIVCDLDAVPLPGVQFPVANEEHGFLTGAVDHLKVGDLVRIVPNHACGTVNMWSKLTALFDDGRREIWPIEARH
ncbi:MAG TPA: alanine racemase [Propionibacteriaceae bacterium]|nr:alanine racemase [Propionibacteriaceae bacterium]